MNMKRLTLITAMSALLAACGGGGSAGNSGTTQPSSGTGTGSGSGQVTAPAGTTLASSNYPAATAQLQIFTAINAYRQQCSFPAFQQNTVLDKAAQNHADYMVANGGTLTHSEVSGTAGFTGATAHWVSASIRCRPAKRWPA